LGVVGNFRRRPEVSSLSASTKIAIVTRLSVLQSGVD
jgi:hypothetical protein